MKTQTAADSYNHKIYTQKILNMWANMPNGVKPLALIKTYGCQQSVYDGEKLRGMLSEMGYDFTDTAENADVILFNTCAVREHAQSRVYGNIGRLKALKCKKPSLIIGVCGCMVEQPHVKEKLKRSFPFVTLMLGTNSSGRFAELLYRALQGEKPSFEWQEGKGEIVEGLPIERFGKVRAFLPIMYGCDNFCSYCVVPFVRGREISRKHCDIITEMRELVNKGYKEITLLGQNVNSYGKGLKEEINFTQLLQKVSTVEGDYWLRFMTSHPKDMSKSLIDEIAVNSKICKSIHLPFQSGCDAILSKMNRKYTCENYLSIVGYIRQKIPGVLLTSDVIIGFPGETYQDLKKTIALIKQVRFVSLFTFIYSKRKGTAAESLPDPVSGGEKLKWMQELLQVQKQIAREEYAKLDGKIMKVLIEGKADREGWLLARNTGNLSIQIKGSTELVGRFCQIKIKLDNSLKLKGEII